MRGAAWARGTNERDGAQRTRRESFRRDADAGGNMGRRVAMRRRRCTPRLNGSMAVASQALGTRLFECICPFQEAPATSTSLIRAPRLMRHACSADDASDVGLCLRLLRTHTHTSSTSIVQHSQPRSQCKPQAHSPSPTQRSQSSQSSLWCGTPAHH